MPARRSCASVCTDVALPLLTSAKSISDVLQHPTERLFFVKINGVTHYLWRAIDHEGEVPESFVTKRRDRNAALNFLRKIMKRYGQPHVIVSDKLRSYGAVMKIIGKVGKQETGHR